MNNQNKLSKLYEKFTKSKDPTDWESFCLEALPLTFFVAYKYFPDKKEALSVTGETLGFIFENYKNHLQSKGIEEWLTQIIREKCKKKLLSTTDSQS